MSGVSTGRAPRSDPEWARDITRRVKATESPGASRAGKWVMATSADGALVASFEDGGTVQLSKSPAVAEAEAAEAAALQAEKDAAVAADLTALQGVQGYGELCMSGNYAPGSSYATAPFDTEMGPFTGCHVDGYEIVIDKPGLWECDAQAMFDTISVTDNQARMSIVVRDEFGIQTRRRQVLGTSNNLMTLSGHLAMWCLPGDRWRIECLCNSSIRSVLSGPEGSEFMLTRTSAG